MIIIKSLGVKESNNKLLHMSIARCTFCGAEHELSTDYLNNRSTDRCYLCKKVRHGMSKHPLYSTWKGMLHRCYNPKNKHYKNYGALGVTVCDEWKNSVKSFIDWAESNGYEKGLKLDKDVKSKGTKKYSPETCMFVTNTVNNRVTRRLRKTNTSGYRGVHLDKNTRLWVAGIRNGGSTLYLGSYKTPLEAAKVYDYYIVINSLEHTQNKVLSKDEIALPVLRPIRSDNSSGFTGVCKVKSKKLQWKAYMYIKGKQVNIGRFSTAKLASEARAAYKNRILTGE